MMGSGTEIAVVMTLDVVEGVGGKVEEVFKQGGLEKVFSDLLSAPSQASQQVRNPVSHCSRQYPSIDCKQLSLRIFGQIRLWRCNTNSERRLWEQGLPPPMR
jgi:hypothetical protein